MPLILPSVTRVEPNYVDPRLILQINQASGAFETIGEGEPKVRLGDGDLYVYMKTLELRTKAAAAQAAINQLPSCELVGAEISTPTYLLQNRAEYGHHDTAAGGRWGIDVAKGHSLAMRQGHFQLMRGALLYGMNPQNGEGLLNAPGSTAVNLPADTNGNTTVSTYDAGQLAQFLLQQILSIKTAMYQLGMPLRVVILGPQRILGYMEYVDIVQLVQYQRAGAGSATTKGLIQDIMATNRDEFVWCYDDTLIGKGSGGLDAIIITIPEIDVPDVDGISTAPFNRFQPSLESTIEMYMDMAAPREIPVPIPGGAVDVTAELRITSGWPIRPEALIIASMGL